MSVTIGASYILPLESIDLTYLNNYVCETNQEKQPLWTKQRLDGESEYYRVQITTQNSHEDGCYFEPCDTYKCHICNVNVPITCYKDHIQSKKHEIYKNIFETVLERVARQINFTNFIDKEMNDDVYYCQPCSTVIKKENKNKHEASFYHVEEIKNTDTANEFYKIIKEDCNHIHVQVTKGSVVDKSDVKINVNNKYGAAPSFVDNNLDSDDDFLSLTSGTDKDISESNNIIKTVNFEEYLKKVIKEYNINVNVPQVVGENISIMAPNRDQVKITRENFHSYKQLTDVLYCQMCSSMVEVVASHDVTENHVKNIFKSVDENFARKIDQYSNHCLICNEVVLSNSNHHLDEKHIQLIKNTKVLSNNDISKTNKTFCDCCNVFIDTHNFEGHTKSKKHITKHETYVIDQNNITKMNSDDYFCNVCDSCFVKNNLNNHINNKSHVAKKDGKQIKDSNELYCETCQVKIPSGGMETHINGKPHNLSTVQVLCTELRNELLTYSGDLKNAATADNGTTSTDSANSNTDTDNKLSVSQKKLDEYHKQLLYTDDTKLEVKCKVCYVVFPFIQQNVIDHMEGRSHIEIVNKQKMNEFSKMLMYTDEAKTKVKCKICNVNVPYLDRNIIEHMEGANHAKSVKQKIDVYNKMLVYTNDAKTEVKCKICNVSVPHLDRNIIEHMEGANHAASVKQKMDVYNKMLVYTNDAKTEVKCKICNVSVPYLDRNIIEHMEGANHAKSVKQKMDVYNKMLVYTNDAKTEVKCKICNVSVPYLDRNIIEHMEGANHAKSVKQKMDVYNKMLVYTNDGKTEVKCKICNVSVPHLDRNIFEHMEGANHAASVKQKMDVYNKMLVYTNDAKTEVKCKICNVQITPYLNITVINHMESISHTERENKLKINKYNRMLKFADNAKTNVKCEICDVTLPHLQKSIMVHMEDTNHRTNEDLLLNFHKISYRNSEFYCEYCKEFIVTNVSKHIDSERHSDTLQDQFEIDKEIMREYVYENNINDMEARVYRQLYKNILFHNKIDKLDNRYYCNICHIFLPRISEIDHVLGAKHDYNIRKQNPEYYALL